MKERISITIDKELLDWIDGKIAAKVFASRSHALEFLVMQKVEEEEGFGSYHQNVAMDDALQGRSNG